MAVVLTGLLFSLSASAATTAESCGVVPIQQLTYTTTTQVDKFDTNLGTLQSVTITAESCGYLSNWLESQDLSEIDYNIIARGQVIPTIPGVPEEALQIGTDPAGIDFHAVPDGSPTDRAGTDYTRIDIGSAASPECTGLKTYSLTGAAMAPYEAVGGGKVTIPVRTHSSLLVDGSNNYESGGLTYMGVTVCVVYEYQPFLCIKGSKVNDCTGEGLPGWTINLMDASGAVIATKPTDANGEYSFCNLVPGSYTVCEVMQAGWKNVGDICKSVDLVDADVEGVDFSNTPPFCISGYKLNNLDDTGLKGWTINLKDASGAQIATTTTGTDGSYQFCGLFPGSYTVCEVMQAGWKSVGDTCKPVTLDCGDVTNIDFRNEKVNLGCSNRCPWRPVSELYRATCGVPLEVDAAHGVLANDPVGSTVLNPASITIDSKYGTISVDDDGSFVYYPADKIVSGTYVIFYYGANNGNCDSTGLGMAKIQVYCKR
jgi:hypothetical protein